MKVVTTTFTEFRHQCVCDLDPLGIVFAEVEPFAVHLSDHGIEVGLDDCDLCELALFRFGKVLLE